VNLSRDHPTQRKEDVAAITDVEGADVQVTPRARRKERKKPAQATKGQLVEVGVASEDVVDLHPGTIVVGVDVEVVDPTELREHLSLRTRPRPLLPMMRRSRVKVAMEKEGVAVDAVEVAVDAVGVEKVVVEADLLVVSIVVDEAAEGLDPTDPVIKKSIRAKRIRRRSQPTAPIELLNTQQPASSKIQKIPNSVRI